MGHTSSTRVSRATHSEIISKLTIEEKTSLLAGASFWRTAAVPRLSIPSLKLTDGPNGARGAQFQDGVGAACFPSGISMASTWNKNLVHQIGVALGREALSKGAQVLLGPTVCPIRDPRGGRNFETFSEDPMLSGTLAAEVVKGIQSQSVAATVKHFAVNEQETGRFNVDAKVDERTLREIYLKPFEIVVKEARPWALMTSYNLVNGIHADENVLLLQTILRDQWKFDGLVMSDWGGTNSVTDSLKAGLDLEMPGPPVRRTLDNIKEALDTKTITEEVLDGRIQNLLNLIDRVHQDVDPSEIEERAIDRPEDRQLIRSAGSEGMVLLKNADDILPLCPKNVVSIAMVGLAKEYLGHGGGSAAVNSIRKISPYEAFATVLGDETKMVFAQGVQMLRNLPPFSTGVVNDQGEPGWTVHLSRSKDGQTVTDTQNLKIASMKAFEDPSLLSATAKATFYPTNTGAHYLSFNSVGPTKVLIDGEVIFENQSASVDIMAFIMDIAKQEQKQFNFVSGRAYKVEIRAMAGYDTESNLLCMSGRSLGFNLGFAEQSAIETDLLKPAVEAAKSSDVAIVFVGHTPSWETEGCDRVTLALPKDGSQDRLVAAVAKANPKTIIINSTGSPITMPWLDDVAAVIQAWFPDQEAGHAIADIVFGNVNPGGKLPVSFPRTTECAPTFTNFPGDIDNNVVSYKEGLDIGYRYYDSVPESVLFPFGFGMSYTSFSLDNFTISHPYFSDGDSTTVTTVVTNKGARSGSEVVQLYLVPLEPRERITTKTLVGFRKTWLSAEESSRVCISFDRRGLAFWDAGYGKWKVNAGRYAVMIATSSVQVHGKVEFEVKDTFSYDP